MAEPTRHTVTVSDVGPDRGHGSLPRRHPANTTGTGEYFHGIDDEGRKALWFAPPGTGRVRVGHRLILESTEFLAPGLGLARPHGILTWDTIQAPLPAWCRLPSPLTLLQRAIREPAERLHRQVLADWLADCGHPLTATLAEALRLSLRNPETFFLPYPLREQAAPFTCAWDGWLFGNPPTDPGDPVSRLWLDLPESIGPPRRQGRYPEAEPNTTRLRNFRDLWRWIDRNHHAGFSLATWLADRMARSSKRPNYWTDWAEYLRQQDIPGEVAESLARPNPFNPGGLHHWLHDMGVRGYLNLTYGQLEQLLKDGTLHRDPEYGFNHTELERFRESHWVVENLG